MGNSNNESFLTFILVFLAILLGVMQVFTVVAITVVNKNNAAHNIEDTIDHLQKSAQSYLSLPLWQFNTLVIDNYLSTLIDDNHIIYISIVSTEGFFKELAEDKYKENTFSHFQKSTHFISTSSPLMYEGKKIGLIRIVFDKESFYPPRSMTHVLLMGVNCILVLFVVFLFYYFLKSHIIAPLQSMTEGLRSNGNKSLLNLYSKRFIITEIHNLAETLCYSARESETRKEETYHANELQEINKKLQMEIVERHQAEKMLKKSEEKFLSVLNNSPDTLYNINLNSGTFDYVSPSCIFTTGYEQDELVSMGLKGIMKFFHRNDIPSIKKHFLSHLSADSLSPETTTIEYRFNHKNLGYRDISDTRTVIFNTKGKPTSIVGSARDITDQKEAEVEGVKLQAKLRQSQKMEAIGTLAGGIAHDFNNILGAILGYADMVKDDVVPGSSVDRDLDEIIRAGDRAKDLVKQILAYSRKEVQEQINTSIKTIVKETVKLMRATIPSSITISVHIDQKCGNILADPTQIHQVIMNLCANASHAVEQKEDGEISVSLTREPGYGLRTGDVSLPPIDTYVVLKISDNGVGIPPGIIDRIFDPYFTTKEAGKGSGMGLTVVSGIVKAHGGAIAVESDLDSGTSFIVYLPEVPPETAKEKERRERIHKGVGNIMLVDDEEAIVSITQRRLERMGYEVASFTKSREALHYFQQHHDEFDLIISDQTMPELTGDQLTREILSLRHDIPVILCSGYSDTINEEKAQLVGVKAFLMKPVDKYELSKVVNSIIRGEEADPSQAT